MNHNPNENNSFKPNTSQPNPNMMPDGFQSSSSSSKPFNANPAAGSNPSSSNSDSPFQPIGEMTVSGGYNGPLPGKALSVAGLICGICSIVLSIIAIGLNIVLMFTGMGVLPLVLNLMGLASGAASIGGIIMSVVGGNKNINIGAPRGNIAVAGIVCGIVGLVLCGIGFVFTGCSACVSQIACSAAASSVTTSV